MAFSNLLEISETESSKTQNTDHKETLESAIGSNPHGDGAHATSTTLGNIDKSDLADSTRLSLTWCLGRIILAPFCSPRAKDKQAGVLFILDEKEQKVQVLVDLSPALY